MRAKKVRNVAEIEKLPECELQIMKLIWDAEGPISQPEIKNQIEQHHNREYGRSTISTWLTRLKKKKYVDSYVERGISYYMPLISEDEYKGERLKEFRKFWFKGSATSLLSAVVEQSDITDEDIQEMQEILDEWNKR